MASTFNNHIILIGLGHLGFRVARQLYEMDQEVVALELNPAENLITRAQAMGIPVVSGDARHDNALQEVGLDKARAILLCTQNDSMNLQIAIKAKNINPDIRVVMRIFDEEFAQMLEDQFGFRAMSATLMAAPSFAAAAAGVDITRPITVEGEAFSLARINIPEKSKLIGCSMSAIEQKYDLSIVLHRQDHDSDFHPIGEKMLAVGDVLAVFGGPEQIGRLLRDN